jgi:HK97 family phage major capsid protein
MDTKQLLQEAKAKLAEAKKQKLKALLNNVSEPKKFGKLSEKSVQILKKWGCYGSEHDGEEVVKNFDRLLRVNTADKKYSYIPKEEREQLRQFKEAVDVAVILSKIFKKPITELKFFKEDLEYRLKAFGIGLGAEGYEWIPTIVSDTYVDEYNIERKVSTLFTEIKMPSNPYKFPVLSNGAIARKIGEVTALSPSQTFKTDNSILLDAVKFTNQYALPEELNEDSAVDMVKVIRQELIEGQEKALEIAILEGDKAGTMHHFSQLPDVAPNTPISTLVNTPETAFDGLRKRAIAAGGAAKVDAGGNALTEAELSLARQKLKKFGVVPSDLAIIVSPKVYNQMLQLDDVRTMEQYGAQATVLSGELAKYEGIPVIVSEYLREDCDATGVNSNTPANNNKGSLIIVNRKRFFVGTRRAINILVEKNRTQYDVLDLVSFARKAFEGILKADGSNYSQESSVVLIHNIGL